MDCWLRLLSRRGLGCGSGDGRPTGGFWTIPSFRLCPVPSVGLLAFFVAGWTLMVFAMMLPTSLPLISLFQVMVRDRPDWLLLTALLIAGYLGVWAWFGVAAHVGDMLLHWAADRNGWLSANSWAVGAGILAVAGAYQFSPLKYKCLDKCRSPWSFILQRWTGSAYRTQALRLGIHHGVYCAPGAAGP